MCQCYKFKALLHEAALTHYLNLHLHCYVHTLHIFAATEFARRRQGICSDSTLHFKYTGVQHLYSFEQNYEQKQIQQVIFSQLMHMHVHCTM